MAHLARTAPPVVGALLALVLSACSEASEDAGTEPASPSSSEAASTSPAAPPPSASPSEPAEEPAEEPEPVDPVSMAAYFAENRTYDGGDLRLGAVRERTADYTSYDVSYRGDGLRITGVLNVPAGRGPFPAVVLAHGYIDPAVYVSGQGMTRERGYLASRGYVALHVDYRAHAGSGGTVRGVRDDVQLGYVADVLNAASALRETRAVPVDDARVGIMGRSMGGGVVLRALAAAPDVFHAGVAWAAVSSRQDENFDRWSREDAEEVAYFDRTRGLPGTPRGRAFWDAVSARPFFDRVTAPVLNIHGRSDDTCPPRWASATQRALVRAGADSELAWYDDGHAFGPRFERAMDDAIRFLESAPPRG